MHGYLGRAQRAEVDAAYVAERARDEQVALHKPKPPATPRAVRSGRSRR